MDFFKLAFGVKLSMKLISASTRTSFRREAIHGAPKMFFLKKNWLHLLSRYFAKHFSKQLQFTKEAASPAVLRKAETMPNEAWANFLT